MLVENEVQPSNDNDVAQPRSALLIGLDEKKLFDLAIDIWKLEKSIKKVLDVEECRQIKSSLNRLRKYTESYGIETIDYDNEKFHDNHNVKILASEENADIEEPIIVETIKPAVLADGTLVSHATVIINTPRSIST